MFFKAVLFIIFTVYLFLMILILSRWFPKRTRPFSIQERRPFDDSDQKAAIIELIDVDKAFDHPVLKGVSLTIYRGETLGVLGRSGTGKSVLLKLIVGLLRPDRGQILFESADITAMGEGELLNIRKAVSYVFQSGAMFDFLSVGENIAYPLREQGWTDEEQIAQRVNYLLDAVELEGWGNARFTELSVGAKKQVAIARAIANNPEAILYDEPTTGVDPIIGKSLSRLIRKLNRQEHLTSIVVTHDLRCVEIVSDRILLLKDGLVHFMGTKEEFHDSQDLFIQAFIAGKRYEESDQEELAV